jgi:hypothetical protein
MKVHEEVWGNSELAHSNRLQILGDISMQKDCSKDRFNLLPQVAP